MLGGKPAFVHSLSNQARFKHRAADQKLPPGQQTIAKLDRLRWLSLATTRVTDEGVRRPFAAIGP